MKNSNESRIRNQGNHTKKNHTCPELAFGSSDNVEEKQC